MNRFSFMSYFTDIFIRFLHLRPVDFNFEIMKSPLKWTLLNMSRAAGNLCFMIIIDFCFNIYFKVYPTRDMNIDLWSLRNYFKMNSQSKESSNDSQFLDPAAVVLCQSFSSNESWKSDQLSNNREYKLPGFLYRLPNSSGQEPRPG